MIQTRTLKRLALGVVLVAPIALNGCSFISIGAGVAAALAGGGGGGSDGGPPSPQYGGPPWHNLSSMSSPRWHHSLTLLPDGLAMAVGGLSNTGAVLGSAEIYDHEQDVWQTTGSLANPRYSHTATQVDNGWVAVVGGLNSSGGVLSIELYDPLTGTWSTGATPGGGHTLHTATALRSYELLVTGTNGNAAAERYDVSLDQWFSTGSMVAARAEAAAVLLGDGRVLVCGGNGGGSTLATAELYDPATDTWTAAATMSSARRQHSATLLRDGRVLVVGGYDDNTPGGVHVLSVEVYNVAADSWTSVAMPRAPRSGHTATLMPDDSVIVVGGQGAAAGSPIQGRFFAERFNPGPDFWDDFGALRVPRFEGHRTVLLTTGTLLVTGGQDIFPGGGPQTRDEVESPLGDPGLLQNRVSLATPRSQHRSVTLSTGSNVLVTGGWNGSSMQSSCELINPDSGALGTRSGTGAMNTARNSHTLIQLSTGTIIAAGGWNGTSYTNSSEQYSPSTGTWSNSMNNLGTARADHSAVLLKTNFILVAGGDNSGGVLSSCEIYDPAMMSWMGTGSMLNARKYFTMNRLWDGRALAVGGWDGTNILQSCEVYNQAAGTWTSTASLPGTPRDRHTATTLPDGRVLVVGGWNGSGAFSTCHIYDPFFSTWVSSPSTPPIPTARRDHMAVQTMDGRILVYGGLNNAGSPIAAPELYDPQTNTWSFVAVEAAVSPVARIGHSLSMHGSQALVIGGDPDSATVALSSIQRQIDLRYKHPDRPLISQVDFISTQPAFLSYGTLVTVSGSNLRGGREGSDGAAGSSPGDMPVVTLTGPVGGASGRTCSGDPLVWRFDGFFHSDGLSVDFQMPPSPFSGGNLGSGIYALRVISNGIPSDPFYVTLP